jgi:hypothetical protein
VILELRPSTWSTKSSRRSRASPTPDLILVTEPELAKAIANAAVDELRARSSRARAKLQKLTDAIRYRRINASG